MSSYITAVDGFCGAGGSSTGLIEAGIEVEVAINHWDLAIETHNYNHPNVDHDIADLQRIHPSRYPRTNILWMSPECTNHSTAKGKKRKSLSQLDLWGESQVDPEEERSRATMREVVEWADYHRNDIVIVENVVDIKHWQYYDDWIQTMVNLGYEYKTLYLNSQFFGVPQSRDRWYTVFWQRGNRSPDLEFRPPAYCNACCKDVDGIQSWKNERTWGKYRTQYIYVCPQCGQEVKPYIVPAATVIDWTIPSPRVGDRRKPLSEKTIEKIRIGLGRYAGDKFLASYYTRQSAHSGLLEPMPTVSTEKRHALVTPPSFIAKMQKDVVPKLLDAPLDTICAAARHHALVTPSPIIMKYYGNAVYAPVTEAMPTVTTVQGHAMIIPDEVIDQCGFRMLEPEEVKLAMSFPQKYVILGNKDDQHRQIGNAVTPNVARWLGQRCVESLVS